MTAPDFALELSAAQLFPLPDPVLAASRWPDNGYLVADCARLGYLRVDWLTLDATFGEGNWWTRWRPDSLITNDLFKPADMRADFRNLPIRAASFDAAVFDPPYVAPGPREKSTVPDFHHRYGLDVAPSSPRDMQVLIEDGLDEVIRAVKPRGFILVKCCDYVWSGRVWWGTRHTWERGLSLGLELVDRLEHIGGTGPQSQITQVHARRNLSTLFVFQKPRQSVCDLNVIARLERERDALRDAAVALLDALNDGDIDVDEYDGRCTALRAAVALTDRPL
jgi:hypothetical protein